MAEEKEKGEGEKQSIGHFLDQSTLVVGFLGAVVFAGLVLMLGNGGFITQNALLGKDATSYYNFLVDYYAFLSGFSAITVISNMVSFGWGFKSMRGARLLRSLSYYLSGLVLALFITGLFFLVAPIDPTGAADVGWLLCGCFAFVMILVLVFHSIKEPSPTRVNK